MGGQNKNNTLFKIKLYTLILSVFYIFRKHLDTKILLYYA